MSRKENFEAFGVQLEARSQELAVMLPSHVSIERFRATALAAVKSTPNLLDATPRTLFAALTKAAQDGILPDGREGAIVVYNTKVKVGGNHKWEAQAQWMPMVFGLRKRARELEGMLVSAEVVYAGDTFDIVLGDDPHLEHRPAPLGTDRGEPLGAYAIYRDSDRRILHREVMDAQQIGSVRAKSRAPDGMLWTEFWTEAWRKTVVRRGFKSVPIGEELDRIARRDDSHFDFDSTAVEETEPRPELPPAVKTEWPRRVDGQWVDSDGVVWDSERHAWSVKNEAPSVRADGTFRARRGGKSDESAEPETDAPASDQQWIADYESAAEETAND